MNQGKTVFAQLMSTISKYEFEKCVERYKGNYKVQSFTSPQNRLIIIQYRYWVPKKELTYTCQFLFLLIQIAQKSLVNVKDLYN